MVANETWWCNECNWWTDFEGKDDPDHRCATCGAPCYVIRHASPVVEAAATEGGQG